MSIVPMIKKKGNATRTEKSFVKEQIAKPDNSYIKTLKPKPTE